MKLEIAGMEMWTYMGCTCKVMCMNGIWMWRTVGIKGEGLENGMATSKEEAKKQAEDGASKINRAKRKR